ncbi:MAG: glycosyltransferase family 4 protein [Myxococcota bacterium]|nr:glycosyltransferase family 4 protein [Myxococcota bacterium]
MSSPRRRLLLLSSLPPPLGGIPTWTVAVLKSALRERFEMRVVDTSPPDKVNIVARSRFRTDRAWQALRILSALLWALVRFRPEILHVNTPYYWAFLRDGLAVWLAGLLGVRTVLHFRGGDFPEWVQGSRPLAQRAIAATLRRCDRLIALTRDTEAYLRTTADPQRVRYVPNFVPLEDFGELPDRSQRSAERPLRVLYVGWLLEAKGVGELLEASRRFPDVRFTLVGPTHPRFAERIRPLIEAVRDHVEVLPVRPREEILELYRDADIFVLPTYREGFPNVVLEAMAAGLPVIATPVGAIPDAIRHGEEGLLVPPRDREALAEALKRLIDDPELRCRMGARARERAEAVFSLDPVVRQLEAVYDELES